MAVRMNMRIISIALAIILALIPSLPALAQESDSETVTITMTTKMVIEIGLEPTNWDIGRIEPNQEYKTDPAYFTMTNKGNCDLHTYIKGDDAVWSDNPDYKWQLSSDGNNSIGIYALRYETSDWEEPNGGLITAEEGDFCSYLSLGTESSKHFGLKLQAPSADYTKGGTGYFYSGGEMKTTITISGVAA